MTTETRDHRAHAAELKFLVTPDLGQAIRAWARTNLAADPHGTGPFADEYSTTTLYSDTPAQDVFHRRGSYARSKYRVRRYGSSDVVFVERKLRTSALLSKRRAIISSGDMDKLQNTPADAHWPASWFCERLSTRRLAPVCQVAYDRTARVTTTPYGLARLTVDSGLRAHPVSTWAYDDAPRYRPVLVGREILELKYMVAMPAIFKRLLETFGLEPERVSKYRSSLAALDLVRTPQHASPEVAGA